MKKLWYTQTTRDSWWPIFFFSDNDSIYRLRLAGNPILLLEAYYNKLGWTNFMETYKYISAWEQSKADIKNIKFLAKAKKQTKEFLDAIIELQNMKKSLIVIYKD